MGIVEIFGEDRIEWFESIVPADLAIMSEGRLRYSFFTNSQGGILDDLMITRLADRLSLVVNAGRKKKTSRISSRRDRRHRTPARPELALLALQGPTASEVLADIYPGVEELRIHDGPRGDDGVSVSRSGYTGEDGFEISLPDDAGRSTWPRRLLENPAVAWSDWELAILCGSKPDCACMVTT